MLPRCAGAALARGEARHAAVPRNQQGIEQVREAWRRSGGRTLKLGQAELGAWYESQLAGVASYHDFRAAPLRFDADAFVPRAERERYAELPGAVEVRGRTCPIHYEVEETPEGPVGVLRIVMPEKVARGLVAEELPAFDRPARFTVTRGARGAVKAESVEALHEAVVVRPLLVARQGEQLAANGVFAGRHLTAKQSRGACRARARRWGGGHRR